MTILDRYFEELRDTGFIAASEDWPMIQLYLFKPALPDSLNAVRWWKNGNAIRYDALRGHAEERMESQRIPREQIGEMAYLILGAAERTGTLVNFGRKSKVYRCLIVPPWPFE